MQLEGLHHIASAFVADKNPALAQAILIDESEAKKLAEAIAGVAKHYKLTPNPVFMAWISLAGTAGIIYYPKIAIYQALKNESIN